MCVFSKHGTHVVKNSVRVFLTMLKFSGMKQNKNPCVKDQMWSCQQTSIFRETGRVTKHCSTVTTMATTSSKSVTRRRENLFPSFFDQVEVFRWTGSERGSKTTEGYCHTRNIS
jgi:hypothetical protein